MSRRRTDPSHLLKLGDRLLRRGCPCLAAQAYQRYADALLVRPLLERARAAVEREPLDALAALARVERLVGASAEGRALAACAYEALGESAVAALFRAPIAPAC